MRLVYSYGRLFLAAWLFVGGLALLFPTSPAAEARETRWRERKLQAIPAEQHAKWIEERDAEDSRNHGYQVLLGVLLGGLGFAAALREAAFLSNRDGR